LSELGSRIGTASGEITERQFLFQRLSVTIQRFNSILLHNILVERDDPDLYLFQTFDFSFFLSFNAWDLYYQGYQIIIIIIIIIIMLSRSLYLVG